VPAEVQVLGEHMYLSVPKNQTMTRQQFLPLEVKDTYADPKAYIREKLKGFEVRQRMRELERQVKRQRKGRVTAVQLTLEESSLQKPN
jgi:hypothetical protein